jgi:hypothetical protein
MIAVNELKAFLVESEILNWGKAQYNDLAEDFMPKPALLYYLDWGPD